MKTQNHILNCSENLNKALNKRKKSQILIASSEFGKILGK